MWIQLQNLPKITNYVKKLNATVHLLDPANLLKLSDWRDDLTR